MNMKLEEALLGKKFRRNKYGLSIWWDTIQSVQITQKVQRINSSLSVVAIEIWVKGNMHAHPLDEIVLI